MNSLVCKTESDHVWVPLAKEFSTSHLHNWTVGKSAGSTNWPFRELVTHVYCQHCLRTEKLELECVKYTPKNTNKEKDAQDN